MPFPYRKRPGGNTPESAGTRNGARFSLKLSAVSVAAVGLMLLAAVAWAFFMGFMVGRGQNPEHSVADMLGKESTPPMPAPDAKVAGQAPAAPDNAAPAAIATTGAPTTSATEAGTPDTTSGTNAASQSGGAYPFARPQGKSLAAWNTGQAPAPRPQGQATAPPRSRTGRPTQTPPAPRFDYSYQTAAFRGSAEAEALRQQMEERGMRARVQKSGKVHLVMVNFRGTEADAARLRQELADMKLGKPLLASKKPVPAGGRSGR